MKLTREEAFVWIPRLYGIGMTLFLGAFALDAMGGDSNLLTAVVGLAMGLLPAIMALATVIVGWKHEGIAALMFLAGALFYAVSAFDRPSWVLVISGPLVIGSILYFASWRVKTRRKLATGVQQS